MKQVIASGGYQGVALFDYIVKATGKKNPKIAIVPTPGGDDTGVILNFYRMARICAYRPDDICLVAGRAEVGFESQLLSQDALWVPGGDTLTTLSIWKAWDMSPLLLKAYRKGIVLSGASAGANVWFDYCVINPRGNEFHIAPGMGIIEGTFCSHYEVESYRRAMDEAPIPPAYPCESGHTLHFINGKLV